MQGDSCSSRTPAGRRCSSSRRRIRQAALLGTWIATSIYTGNAIEGVQGDATLTADFQADTVNGDGGCNGFNGPYTAGEDDISIGPLASTMRACAEDALSTQEQHYLAALQLAKTYRIRGDQLELPTRGRHDRGHVRARPAVPADRVRRSLSPGFVATRRRMWTIPRIRV